MNTKICYNCKFEKDENYFSLSEYKKNTPKCKACCKEYHKNYYLNNKEKVNNRNNNYYSNNKNIVIKKQKNYYKINKEKKINQQKIYLSKNRIKRNLYYSKYEKNKKLNDPFFKIKKNISAKIYSALVKFNSSKNNLSIKQYLPYTIQDLKQHLEKQFEPWMTWKNWGKYNPKIWNDNDSSTWTWQIDHIVPHSKLLYTNVEDENFKKCWALYNLRPYSAKQNILDNNRRGVNV